MFRVNPAGDKDARDFSNFRSERFEVLESGDGMQIDNAENTVKFRLVGNPISDSAKIISNMDTPRRLYPGKDSLSIQILFHRQKRVTHFFARS